jgi:hypothetical protein
LFFVGFLELQNESGNPVFVNMHFWENSFYKRFIWNFHILKFILWCQLAEIVHSPFLKQYMKFTRIPLPGNVGSHVIVMVNKRRNLCQA